MRSMISGAKPGPSSLMVTSTVSSFHCVPTVTRARAKSTAFSSKIAEAVEDRRIARAHRLGAARRRRVDLDGDAEIAVRRHHLLDQRGERHAVERLAAGREFGELAQNVAAARRLLAQQPHVLAMRRVGGDRVLQLLGDHRDGRQRRAEFVRGGGGQAVELREMLLARQHQFGGGQRVGELARFLGDLPGIDADESDGEQEREPDARSCRSAAMCSGSSLSQGSG